MHVRVCGSLGQATALGHPVYACRAGAKTGYPAEARDIGKYGNFADRTLYEARDEVHYVFAHQEADDGHAHEFADVGRFLPNRWGIHDMLGNVAELCCTYYSETAPGGIDPIDQHLKTSRERRRAVIRGGAWCSPLEYLHVAHRNAHTGAPTPHSGVRLVFRQGDRRSRSSKELGEALQAASNKK
ncbi:MAG: SUMF1/EgtB/PvdO family nonheme iron enzyme [Planctomycetales bacterium]